MMAIEHLVETSANKFHFKSFKKNLSSFLYITNVSTNLKRFINTQSLLHMHTCTCRLFRDIMYTRTCTYLFPVIG